MAARRYRKKPVVIEAVQWNGPNADAFTEWTGGNFRLVAPGDHSHSPAVTAEVFDVLHSTWVGVKTGQWIIKGVQGEFYPCDGEVFKATYEASDAVPDGTPGVQIIARVAGKSDHHLGDLALDASKPVIPQIAETLRALADEWEPKDAPKATPTP